MAALPFPYPVTLKNSDWQKKKGLKNKGTKSGVGATLTALEKAFATSSFGKFDPDQLAAETLDPVVLAKKREALKQSLAGEARKLAKLISTADDKINAAIPVFAANSSQDVRKHLQAMKGTLATFETALTTGYPDALDHAVHVAYRAKLQQSSAYMAITGGARNATAQQKQLLAMIKRITPDSTISEIHDLFKNDGPHRVLTTQCKMWDRFVVTQMPQLGKKAGFAGKAMETVFTTPWLEDVANEVNKDATKKLKAMAAKTSESDAVTKFVQEYSRSVINANKFIQVLVKTGTALENV
jgi:hypothetical protein